MGFQVGKTTNADIHWRWLPTSATMPTDLYNVKMVKSCEVFNTTLKSALG